MALVRLENNSLFYTVGAWGVEVAGNKLISCTTKQAAYNCKIEINYAEKAAIVMMREVDATWAPIRQIKIAVAPQAAVAEVIEFVDETIMNWLQRNAMQVRLYMQEAGRICCD